MIRFALCALVSLAPAFAADAPTFAKTEDGQLHGVEQEIVSLVEAMPADKFDFAPTAGEFKGVRTFGQQARHVATIIYVVSAAVLGEKNPVDPGKDENGPALASKAEIVKYLKDAFAYGHRAMSSLTAANAMDEVKVFGGSSTRLAMANLATSHSFDHYGQMVVYLRMNGIVPPASR